MTVEQFDVLIKLLNEVTAPIIAFTVIGIFVFIGFLVFRLFQYFNNQTEQYKACKIAVDNVKNTLRHVKAYRITENKEQYNYYVDCLVNELDELYNK